MSIDVHPSDPTTPAATDATVELIDRYVALWNEPDPRLRRAAIERLWRADGVHVLEPPAEMLAAARAIGFPSVVLQVRGHDALEYRVTTAQREFVEEGCFRFRSAGDASRLGRLVKFHWEMVSADGHVVAAVGLDVLTLDADGRIVSDHQFIES